jgi:hypothetical protein
MCNGGHEGSPLRGESGLKGVTEQQVIDEALPYAGVDAMCTVVAGGGLGWTRCVVFVC